MSFIKGFQKSILNHILSSGEAQLMMLAFVTFRNSISDSTNVFFFFSFEMKIFFLFHLKITVDQ